jgi:DUF1680 family protein
MRPCAILFLLVFPIFGQPAWREEGLLELSRSPQAKLHPVPVRAVQLTGGFWTERQRITIERSIPTLLTLLEEHGVVDNFRRLGSKTDYTPRRGPLYTDSDLYKWIEGAAWSLTSRPDPKLEATIDRLVDVILAAQQPDGYLNTYWVEERAGQRWQQQTSGHELYCLGHMIQGAIAYYRTTGKRKLLDGSIRFVEYLLKDAGPGKQPLLTGHPELELALAELYRTTGDHRYLKLAGYLLSGVERERLKLLPSQLEYMFSGSPFTERTQFEGHAVRALYAATGAADYYLETGDPAYWKTLERLWADLVNTKMFVTGGVGSRASGESFGDSYELPNRQAYTESCAAIAGFLFNQRMLAATGDAKYTDVMERALYNGINSGMSLDGTLYCYRNPLASGGEKIRNPWYDTCCCPPNLQRTFAALGGYFYSTSKDGIWVHFFESSKLDWKLESGTKLQVETKTGQPWTGDVEIVVNPAKEETFTLYVRIPGWSEKSVIWVNGKPAEQKWTPNSYVALRRAWKAGDQVRVALDMEPRLLRASPRVPEDYGKVAVQRGPLVYCLEQEDQAGTSVFDAAISMPAALVPEEKAGLLGGITVLHHKGLTFGSKVESAPLYSTKEWTARTPVELTFVPYYVFHNRGPARMQVWVPAVTAPVVPRRQPAR